MHKKVLRPGSCFSADGLKLLTLCSANLPNWRHSILSPAGKTCMGHIRHKEGMARQPVEGGVVTSEPEEEADQTKSWRAGSPLSTGVTRTDPQHLLSPINQIPSETRSSSANKSPAPCVGTSCELLTNQPQQDRITPPFPWRLVPALPHRGETACI